MCVEGDIDCLPPETTKRWRRCTDVRGVLTASVNTTLDGRDDASKTPYMLTILEGDRVR